jgi:methionyl-tRNA formyltransferase
MDAGDIILQEPADIGPEETAGELERRLSEMGAALMVRTIELMGRGAAPRTPQEEAAATLAPKLAPDEGRIDWRRAVQKITDLVRGVTPKPGAFAFYKGQRLEIGRLVRAEYRIPDTEYRMGEIIGLDNRAGPVVMAGDGPLCLLQLKSAGKKMISGAEFIRGYRPAVGDMLE